MTKLEAKEQSTKNNISALNLEEKPKQGCRILLITWLNESINNYPLLMTGTGERENAVHLQGHVERCPRVPQRHSQS